MEEVYLLHCPHPADPPNKHVTGVHCVPVTCQSLGKTLMILRREDAVIAVQGFLLEWKLQSHSGCETCKHGIHNKGQYILKAIKK